MGWNDGIFAWAAGRIGESPDDVKVFVQIFRIFFLAAHRGNADAGDGLTIIGLCDENPDPRGSGLGTKPPFLTISSRLTGQI